MKTSLYGDHDPREMPAYAMQTVSHHTGVPVPTLKSWIKGRHYPVQGGTKFFAPVITLPDPNQSLLSFTNLVEVHVLNAIRRKENVRLFNVRLALDFLAQHFKSKHPLAEHEFQTDGIDLFVEHLDQIVNVSKHGQIEIRRFIETHLHRIDRDSHGYALRLYPFVRTTYEDLSKPIVIDPFVSFGRSVISGTGITTAIIADRFNAGDSTEKLVADYRLPRLEIEEAIRYEHRAI